MAIKIAVSNAKGGVGKTTTSIMLAQELQRRGKKVLIIDSDPQCNTTKFYGAVYEGMTTLMDILCDKGIVPAEEGVQQLEKGDIIPCEPDLKDAENRIPNDVYRFLHMKRSGKGIDEEYDFIIVDTPPSEGVILRNVLSFVDYVLIPIQESGWATDGLMAYYSNTIAQTQDVTNPNLKILGILIVQSNPRTNISKTIREAAGVLSAKIGTRVLETSIPDGTAVKQALTNYRVPLHEYDPKCKVEKGYEALTEEILGLTRGN